MSKSRFNLMGLFLCLALIVPRADALEVESFSSNGSLSWSNTPGTAYTVQWAPTLTNTWYDTWSALCNIVVTDLQVQVEVPLFYRVVTATNPPPDAIFVSSSGTDVSDCGEPGSPCASISFGITRAQNLGRTAVAVGQGVYPESISMVDGISVLGGFGPEPYWCVLPGCRPTIMGGPLDAQTVLADSITTSDTRLEGFTILAPSPTAAGANSIGVRVLNSNSNLVIRNNCIMAQAGADGAEGSAGQDGTDGGHGSPGQPAVEIPANTPFNNAGGSPGTNSSFGGSSLAGGDGGSAQGPTYDTAEGNGAGADGPSPGVGGNGGWNGKRETPSCGFFVLPVSGSINGTGGNDGGNGSDGPGGNGASDPTGTMSGGQWAGPIGNAGGNGSDGSGGGGGGAGGGSEDISCSGNDVVGPSGGGGGAGGAGARGGNGGSSGGGSFGILIYALFPPSSLPLIVDNEIYLGVAGNGGQGGPGGKGGAGGFGGLPQDPGTFIFGHGDAGKGGDGGVGGPGGGGGGAAGGSSAGIIMNITAPEYASQNLFFTGTGRAGNAGPGGFSAGGGQGQPGVGGIISSVISFE